MRRRAAACSPKFQLTSPGLAAFRCFHTGCVLGPLTSIFSVTMNCTPLSAVNLQISAGDPFSWRPNCGHKGCERSARHSEDVGCSRSCATRLRAPGCRERRRSRGPARGTCRAAPPALCSCCACSRTRSPRWSSAPPARRDVSEAQRARCATHRGLLTLPANFSENFTSLPLISCGAGPGDAQQAGGGVSALHASARPARPDWRVDSAGLRPQPVTRAGLAP